MRDKASRHFAETGRAKGLPGNLVERLRLMLAYLTAIEKVAELKVPPNYGPHMLVGNRARVWSLTLTKNWRLTFRIGDNNTIIDLDLEDYH